jgi:predicted ABC-class ATPase
MVEALKSGIEITFKTSIKVERVYRGWFNLTVGELLYSRSVRYDALSQVYRLHRDDGDEILQDVHAALDRMTRFEVVVPVNGEIERGKPYQAYVRARLDKVGLSEPLRSIVFFSSLWDVETDWARGTLATP